MDSPVVYHPDPARAMTTRRIEGVGAFMVERVRACTLPLEAGRLTGMSEFCFTVSFGLATAVEVVAERKVGRYNSRFLTGRNRRQWASRSPGR